MLFIADFNTTIYAILLTYQKVNAINVVIMRKSISCKIFRGCADWCEFDTVIHMNYAENIEME